MTERARWRTLGIPTRDMRIYKRKWLRRKLRLNPAFREIQKQRCRLYRKTNGAKKCRAYKTRYLADPVKRARHSKMQNKRYRETRKCFGCQLYKRYQRLVLVERLVPIGGKLQKRMVPWCGNC